MDEQISLFDDQYSSSKIWFSCNLVDEHLKIATHEVDGVKNIVISDDRELTKNELKELCRRSFKTERLTYGFKVYFLDGTQNKCLFVRFMNWTTSNKINVFEHIETYFDQEIKYVENYRKKGD